MKILILGGAGFVGSNLVKKLSEDKNNQVAVIDNLSTGSEENMVNSATYIKAETEEIDYILKERLCFTPDIIYHLGEYSRVLTSFEDIDDVVDFNVKGTLAVIEYCRKTKTRLIYAGSSTKFGDAESPYSLFKKQNTEIIKRYGEWYGLDYAIAYFYNVYGKNQISTGRFATLIGILEENIKAGRPHKINEPGTQRRSFTHIDDVINGLILIGEKGTGEYCLGISEEFTILEVAKMFGGPIEMQNKQRGDRNFSLIDLTNIEKLGWKAEKSLADYISTNKNI